MQMLDLEADKSKKGKKIDAIDGVAHHDATQQLAAAAPTTAIFSLLQNFSNFAKSGFEFMSRITNTFGNTSFKFGNDPTEVPPPSPVESMSIPTELVHSAPVQPKVP
eukprot:6096288-Ditylum_brightwellii.AAC.1